MLLKDLKQTGILIVDSANVKSIPEIGAIVHRFPITDTTKKKFGEGLYSNMVMLGVLIQVVGLVSVRSMEEAIREFTARRYAEMNLKAFREGSQFRNIRSPAKHFILDYP